MVVVSVGARDGVEPAHDCSTKMEVSSSRCSAMSEGDPESLVRLKREHSASRDRSIQ